MTGRDAENLSDLHKSQVNRVGELEISFLCSMLQGILVSPEPEVLKVIFPLPSEPQVISGKFFNNSEIRFFSSGNDVLRYLPFLPHRGSV